MAFHITTAAEIRALLGLSPTDVIALKAPAGGNTPSSGTVSSGSNALKLNSTGTATTPHQDAFLSASLASLDIRVKLSTDNLKSSTGFARLVSCFGADGSGWMFGCQFDGNLGFIYANAAGNGIVFPYTGAGAIAVSLTTDTWVRMTYAFSGTGSGVVTMYSSATNSNYVQAGDPQTVAAGSATLKIGTAPLQIGPSPDGLVSSSMVIKGAQVIANGATVVDVDFTSAAVGATSVTASTGQVFTLNAPAAIAASSSVSAAPAPTPAPTPTPAPAPASNVSITYSGPLAMVATPVPATATLIGTYCPNNTQEIADYQTWLGKAPDLASVHTGQGSASDFIGSIDYCLGSNGYSGTKCVSVPLIWNGATLEAAAAGTYDDLYRQAAAKVVAALGNQSVIYVRTGWEHNLYGQMPWASNGKEAAFRGGFQRFYTIFKAASPKIMVVYGPNIGGDDWRVTYPGDAYCDLIGMDFYHYPEFGAPSDPYLAWDFMLTQQYGLNELVSFANAHNKRICIPEWGIRLDDFGPYIKLYYQWCITNNVVYSNYWDSDGAYPSKLSEGSRLLSNGAAYRHYYNPAKYPTEPFVQINLMAGAQDIANTGTWFNGYIGNGTVSRAPNSLVFDGGGNAQGNQQISWIQNTAPVGNYLFAATLTRTAGTDTVSAWVVDQSGNNITTLDLDTAKLPANVATRVAIPVPITVRQNRCDVRFYHGQAGTMTIKATDLGFFEDTTVDPTPHAGGAA